MANLEFREQRGRQNRSFVRGRLSSQVGPQGLKMALRTVRRNLSLSLINRSLRAVNPRTFVDDVPDAKRQLGTFSLGREARSTQFHLLFLIGLLSAMSLIFNRVIGTGYGSLPSCGTEKLIISTESLQHQVSSSTPPEA
jgi:hypothetical protein